MSNTETPAVPLEEQGRVHLLTHQGDFLFINEKISAKKTMHRENINALLAIVSFFAVLFASVYLIFGVFQFWVVVFSTILFFYFASLVFKAFLVIVSLSKKIPSPTREDLIKIDDGELPPYTILVPMYKEGAVLQNFVEHIKKLDYPKEKLDIRLLLEEDDFETRKIADLLDLQAPFKVVVIPKVGPRTKPKALNVGIIDDESEILTIYDAEDRPELDQLKKVVWAFRNLPKEVVCVQSKLTFYNAEENLLTKWFYAEYHSWFNHFLPALFSLSLPIPLGGTSNHFKTSALKEIGAWDPYNVTEDADLGIRLSRLGYKISMLDTKSGRDTIKETGANNPVAVIETSTYEEANKLFLNWFYQRTRWLKGYIQTTLVHLRNPISAWKELGGKGFLSFFFFLMGTPVGHVLNLVVWAITIFWLFGYNFLPIGIPKFLLIAGWISLIAGNGLFIFLHMFPALLQKKWSIAFASIFVPVYWLMMSLATLRALYQLILKPHYWDKTRHGITRILFTL